MTLKFGKSYKINSKPRKMQCNKFCQIQNTESKTEHDKFKVGQPSWFFGNLKCSPKFGYSSSKNAQKINYCKIILSFCIQIFRNFRI